MLSSLCKCSYLLRLDVVPHLLPVAIVCQPETNKNTPRMTQVSLLLCFEFCCWFCCCRFSFSRHFLFSFLVCVCVLSLPCFIAVPHALGVHYTPNTTSPLLNDQQTAEPNPFELPNATCFKANLTKPLRPNKPPSSCNLVNTYDLHVRVVFVDFAPVLWPSASAQGAWWALPAANSIQLSP